jgi:hypothetical protein
MVMDKATRARARAAMLEVLERHLLDERRDINLIDMGEVIKAGEVVPLAIRYHVTKRLTTQELTDRGINLLPTEINGFKTDVIKAKYQPRSLGWSTTVTSGSSTERRTPVEPVRGGISIGAEYFESGTLGGIVMDRTTRQKMILSNWHVLVARWYARSGQRIFQPSRYDGGSGANVIANYTRHAMHKNLDAAVAVLNDAHTLSNVPMGMARPVTAAALPELETPVEKSGRSSKVTFGRVTGILGIARMRYDGVERILRDVVAIDPQNQGHEVSSPGDSGAWWLESSSKRAIGLHFAGSNLPERALALDIQEVLDALDVEIPDRL